jgi:hypothetical protein
LIKTALAMNRFFHRLRRRRLRLAREKYVAAKARKEALLRLRELRYWSFEDAEAYVKTSADIAKYEERVESIMREF